LSSAASALGALRDNEHWLTRDSFPLTANMDRFDIRLDTANYCIQFWPVLR